jgi:hypothetical protein
MIPATEVPSLGALQELLERAIVSAKAKELVINIPPSDVRRAEQLLSAPSVETMPLVNEFLSSYNHRQKTKHGSEIRGALEAYSVWTVADLTRFRFTEFFAGTSKRAISNRSLCVAFLRWLVRNNTEASDVAATCLGRAYVDGYRTVLPPSKDGAV